MDVPPVPGDAEEILVTCTAANAKPAALKEGRAPAAAKEGPLLKAA